MSLCNPREHEFSMALIAAISQHVVIVMLTFHMKFGRKYPAYLSKNNHVCIWIVGDAALIQNDEMFVQRQRCRTENALFMLLMLLCRLSRTGFAAI